MLRGNLLTWFRDKKNSQDDRAKPKGLIYCDKCRVYEIDDKKQQYAFQLDTGAVQHNLAAAKLEDMKQWMTDLKEAKKKALAQIVVSGGATDTPTLSPRVSK